MSVPENVLAAMRETNELFNARVVRDHDMQALDQVYTSDAHVLPPGAPMVEGREAIKQFWQQAIAGMNIKEAKLETALADECGGQVLEIGRADLTVDGDQRVAIKYVVYWKQEQGRWKWHVDIWNPNQ